MTLPTFTCRCGAVVPAIEVWRLNDNGWESDFCSEACLLRHMKPPPDDDRAPARAKILSGL